MTALRLAWLLARETAALAVCVAAAGAVLALLFLLLAPVR